MEESPTFYLDSNFLINAAGNDDFIGNKARKIVLEIENSKIHASTSCLTIDELLWILRKTNKEFIEICRTILNSKIRFLDANKSIILISLDIASEYNLKPRDAIHAATMKAHNIKNLISEDADFDKIEWIKRKSINEF